MESKPLISIIMPVFNELKYLHEAIESVLVQTYENWELILVDDGSSDGSESICDEYAEHESRIRVIHQKNRGLSCARNVGVDAAEGDWIQFLDADDMLMPEALHTLTDHCEDVDLVTCGYMEYPRGRIRQCVDRVKEYTSLESIANDFADIRHNGFFNPQWNKLYKRDCLGVRNDPETDGMEDVFFSLDYLSKCERIRVIPDILVKYRILPDRITMGNQFVLHYPRMADRMWSAFDEIFAGKDAVMDIISADVASGVIDWLISLVNNGKINVRNQKMIIQMCIVEEMNCRKVIRLTKLSYVKKLLWITIILGNEHLIFVAAKRFGRLSE